jgi:hypothetical protein
MNLEKRLFILIILILASICSHAQIINPNKKTVKKYFELIQNGLPKKKTKLKILKEIFEITCNNDDSAFFKNDTTKFYSSNELFWEENPNCELYLKIIFYKKRIVLFSGNIPIKEPLMGWKEGLLIKYYSRFFNIKTVSPKYALSTYKGKTILTIKRYQKIDEYFYVYKIEEVKNNNMKGPNFIFTLIRVVNKIII